MPITIDGDGTITGVSVGGLPDGIVDADMLASNAVTTAKISDSQITEAKLASDPQQGIAKAWVNFDGTGTVAIADDFNVASITDNGTGNYTVSYTNAMPNANYAVIATIGGGSTSSLSESTQVTNLSTTGVQVLVGSDGSTGNTYTSQDASTVCVAVFGD